MCDINHAIILHITLHNTESYLQSENTAACFLFISGEKSIIMENQDTHDTRSAHTAISPSPTLLHSEYAPCLLVTVSVTTSWYNMTWCFLQSRASYASRRLIAELPPGFDLPPLYFTSWARFIGFQWWTATFRSFHSFRSGLSVGHSRTSTSLLVSLCMLAVALRSWTFFTHYESLNPWNESALNFSISVISTTFSGWV